MADDWYGSRREMWVEVGATAVLLAAAAALIAALGWVASRFIF